MSEESIFSSSWYRVRDLKPRLRSHAEIHRHRYRGEIWYVLEEQTTERFFRFTPAVYSVIGLMDGRLTVDTLWQRASTLLGDDAPTQDEMIRLLAQLYQADVLQCDVPPDAAELLKRRDEQSKKRFQSSFFSVLSWRFPLIDPEWILQKLGPVVGPMFGVFGFLVWLAVVVPGMVLFATNWNALTEGVLDRVLVADNVIILWVLFPIIKVFHEFGHAFATKAYGGEVHEMGFMLLVVTPVPYVDASAASAFQKKWRRVVVGAAGMLVEMVIASIALFFWLNAEPGFARSIAYNAIFIAGISTLLFNANPLLRYDGYYILSDLIEIPNLRNRSNQYLFFLAERYLFGNVHAHRPDATVSERVWFVSFGILSFCYRIFVVTAILLFISTRFFTLGLALAIAAAVLWFAVPLFKGAKFLVSNPRIRSVRVRAIAVTLVILVGLVYLIGFVPIPYRTQAEGVIWIPDEALVRAGTEGFIESLLVEPGSRVTAGTPLVALENTLLEKDERVALAREQELEARYIEALPNDPVGAESVLDELGEVRESLAEIQEELTELTVRSPVDGIFVVPLAEDLPGRHVAKGDLLGYTVESDRITVRTVVSQPVIDLVRSRTNGVEVRLAERIDEIIPAEVVRIVPGASANLPSRALGSAGGGRIATDPGDSMGLTAVERVFQVDLEIPREPERINLGGRTYVRFDHGWEPLAAQWYFQLRQLFLSRFNI